MKLILSLLLLLAMVGCKSEAPPVSSGGVAVKEYPWSGELRNQISLKLDSFKAAVDWKDYCAGFYRLSDTDKIEVIYALAIQICKYESNCYDAAYSPDDYNGTDSIGLYQLSYEDDMKWCAMDYKKKNLIDPYVNIKCAIPEMARLIKQDEQIAGGYEKGTRKGLSRYWAVMWNTVDSKQGHLEQIKEAVNLSKQCRSL